MVYRWYMYICTNKYTNTHTHIHNHTYMQRYIHQPSCNSIAKPAWLSALIACRIGIFLTRPLSIWCSSGELHERKKSLCIRRDKSLQVLIWMQSKEIALSFDWQLQCLRKPSYSLDGIGRSGKSVMKSVKTIVPGSKSVCFVWSCCWCNMVHCSGKENANCQSIIMNSVSTTRWCRKYQEKVFNVA